MAHFKFLLILSCIIAHMLLANASKGAAMGQDEPPSDSCSGEMMKQGNGQEPSQGMEEDVPSDDTQRVRQKRKFPVYMISQS